MLRLARLAVFVLVLLPFIDAVRLDGEKPEVLAPKLGQVAQTSEDDTTEETVARLMKGVGKGDEEQEPQKAVAKEPAKISAERVEQLKKELSIDDLPLSFPIRGTKPGSVDDISVFLNQNRISNPHLSDKYHTVVTTEDLDESASHTGGDGGTCGIRRLDAKNLPFWTDVKPDGSDCVPNGKCMATESIDNDGVTFENHRCVPSPVFEVLQPLREAVANGKQGLWKHIKAEELLMDIGEKIFQSGHNMKQNRRNICGPLTVVNAMIRGNAVRWAKAVVDLFFKGEAQIRHRTLRRGEKTYTYTLYLLKPRAYVRDLDPRTVSSFGRETISFTANPQLADWILTVAMRDSRTVDVMKNHINYGKAEEDKIQDTLSIMKGGDFSVMGQTDTLSTTNDLLFWCSNLFNAHCTIKSFDNGEHLKYLADVTPSGLVGIEAGAQQALGAMARGGNPMTAGRDGVAKALAGATPSFIEHIQSKFTMDFVQALGKYATRASLSTIGDACSVFNNVGSFVFVQVEMHLMEHFGSIQKRVRALRRKKDECLRSKPLTWDERRESCQPKGEDKAFLDDYAKRRKIEQRLAKDEKISEEEESFMRSQSLDLPTCMYGSPTCLPNHWVGLLRCPVDEDTGEITATSGLFSVWSWGQIFLFSPWELQQFGVMYVTGRKYSTFKEEDLATLENWEDLQQ